MDRVFINACIFPIPVTYSVLNRLNSGSLSRLLIKILINNFHFVTYKHA